MNLVVDQSFGKSFLRLICLMSRAELSLSGWNSSCEMSSDLLCQVIKYPKQYPGEEEIPLHPRPTLAAANDEMCRTCSANCLMSWNNALCLAVSFVGVQFSITLPGLGFP